MRFCDLLIMSFVTRCWYAQDLWTRKITSSMRDTTFAYWQIVLTLTVRTADIREIYNLHVFTVEFTYQILTINFNSKLYISCYYTYWSPMVRYFRFVFLSSHFLIRYTITRNLITREARCCRSLKKKRKKKRKTRYYYSFVASFWLLNAFVYVRTCVRCRKENVTKLHHFLYSTSSRDACHDTSVSNFSHT